MCTRAAVGDAVISLIAFWLVSATWRTRGWITEPSRNQKVAFIAVGLILAIALEVLATRVSDRWDYAGTMPMVPVIGIGLLPILQWMVLPPFVLWLVRRQLR